MKKELSSDQSNDENHNNVDELIQVKKVQHGVELTFSNEIPQEVVEQQVASCQAETCDCCTPVFREQVDHFSHAITEQGLKVTIAGDITAEQVKENVLSCAPKLKP